MAEMTYRMTADEKQALEACKRVEQAHEKIGNAAERAGTKSKQGSDKAKSGHDSVKQSIDASVSSLASVLSVTTAITFAVNEMKTAWASIEGSMDRLNRKNATLADATAGMIGPDGRLLQTSLREAIAAKTQRGPIGTEEGTALIASMLKANNELGMGAVGYLDQLKSLKGAANLQALAPAIGTISDLMPELLPQDVADVALIAGQNAGFGKLGEVTGVIKELQSKGISNAQALELAVRAQASDQGSRAVRSVIGALEPSEQERLAAATTGRPALTGDARLAAIYANPTQYLGAAGGKIQAALNEGLPSGGDMYKQALMKDIVARTAAAAAMDPSIRGERYIAGLKTRQEAAVSSVETQSQGWEAAMELDATKLIEQGYAPDSAVVKAARARRGASLYAFGADDSNLRTIYGKTNAPPAGASIAGMTVPQFLGAATQMTSAATVMMAAAQLMFGNGKKVNPVVAPPQ